MQTTHPPMVYKPWQIWWLAIRPKTLPAAAAPVIVGTAAAYLDGALQVLPALAALLSALCLQIGANLANDVFDFRRGVDTQQRLGPVRVTQAGLLSPRQVLSGMWLVFGIAAGLGLYLTWQAGWVVIAIGAISILAAIAYTGGPLPLGYYGLGDITAFLFFGPVAVCGSYFIQAGDVSRLVIWLSVSIGLLVTAILVVNNLRDLDLDRAAGKHTLAVRIGSAWTRREYAFCLVGAYLVVIASVLAEIAPAWVLLAGLSIPMGWRMADTVYRQSGRPLNKALAGTGMLTLIFGLLVALGLILAGL